MNQVTRFNVSVVALCTLLFGIADDAVAASLGGHCTNWMTSSLNDESSMAADVETTAAACTALSQSGDFVTRYETRSNTCLICNREDWTPSVSGGKCSVFHGGWGWKTGPAIDIHPNGTFLRGGKVQGNWGCNGNQITLDWNKGYIDTLTLSANGKTMSGQGRKKGSSNTHPVGGYR